MGIAVPYPNTQPPGYEWFADEPVFDPARHLQLEAPADIVLLAEMPQHEPHKTSVHDFKAAAHSL